MSASASAAPASKLVTNLRIFLIGGNISYRALFNWLHPAIYIPTMLGSPLFQILFFSYVGRYSGLRDDSFFVVGNAVQVSAMAGIYGMTMTVANERYFGTLMPLLASPAARIPLFLGRAIPPLVNGLIVSTFGFCVGLLLLDFSLAVADVPTLVAVVTVTVFACTAFGMMLGSIGLRARDVFFVSNLVYFLMLLVCGVNVPFGSLPGWLQSVGRALPLTHGIEAARAVAGGGPWSSVQDLVVTEASIGVLYAFLAYGLFRFFEFEGRRTGSLTNF